MSQIIDQIQRVMSAIPDPAMRNGIALSVCMLLYCVYLRARENQPRARSRAFRTADSVLRDVVVR